jgi:Fur family transcriptional regulator, iron response regulator
MAGRFIESRLTAAGVRLTPQRVGLARLLWHGPHRHVTAADLLIEAQRAGLPVSLATVYNTLNDFVDAGLLRALELASARGVFDTNPEPHHHLVDGQTGEVFDLPLGAVTVTVDPAALPLQTSVERIEVWVRLRGSNPEGQP